MIQGAVLEHAGTAPHIVREDLDARGAKRVRLPVAARAEHRRDVDAEIIEEQQKTADTKKRIQLLQQAGKMIMEEACFIPLYNLADIYGVAKNVDWKKRADEKVKAWDMKIKA